MAKIAYNGCFGGFILSDEAMLRYAELKGIQVYPEDSGYGTALYWTEPPTGGVTDNNRKLLSCRDMDRDDPILIQTIEELGNKANGMCAELRIAEVQPGTAYRIDEYDGNESVMTINDYEWKTARE